MQELKEYINEGIIKNFFLSLKRFFFGDPEKTKDIKIDDTKLESNRKKQLENDKQSFFRVMSNLIRQQKVGYIIPGTIIRIDYKLSDISKEIATSNSDVDNSSINHDERWSMWYVCDKMTYQDIEKSFVNQGLFQYLNSDKTRLGFKTTCVFYMDGKKMRPKTLKNQTFIKYPIVSLWDIDKIIINNDNDLEDCKLLVNTTSDISKQNIKTIVSAIEKIEKGI